MLPWLCFIWSKSLTVYVKFLDPPSYSASFTSFAEQLLELFPPQTLLNLAVRSRYVDAGKFSFKICRFASISIEHCDRADPADILPSSPNLFVRPTPLAAGGRRARKLTSPISSICFALIPPCNGSSSVRGTPPSSPTIMLLFAFCGYCSRKANPDVKTLHPLLLVIAAPLNEHLEPVSKRFLGCLLLTDHEVAVAELDRTNVH